MTALRALIAHIEMGRRPVRLLGVSLSGLGAHAAPGAAVVSQLSLFS